MTKEVTIIFGFVGFLIWIRVGILYHLATGDEPFSWADPWLYVTIGLWPIFLLGWIIAAFLLFLACLLGYWYVGVIRDEKSRNQSTSKARARFEEHRRKTTLPHHRK